MYLCAGLPLHAPSLSNELNPGDGSASFPSGYQASAAETSSPTPILTGPNDVAARSGGHNRRGWALNRAESHDEAPSAKKSCK